MADTTQFGLTPKVARLHWDDILSRFELHISWQLVTPFGAFPQKEEVLTLGDLAGALNAIKTIWGLVGSTEQTNTKKIYAVLGDFTQLTVIPDGMEARTKTETIFPVVDVAAIVEPDTIVPYVGDDDDWGATTP